MISPQELLRYLLRLKLLRGGEVAGDGVAISNASRRNLIFKVTCKHGASYLIKQGIGRDRIAAIRREAIFYRTFATPEGLLHYLPRLYDYDPVQQILVLELMTDFQDLRIYQESRSRTPAVIGNMLGNALAEIHSLRSETSRSQLAIDRMPHRRPWLPGLIVPSIQALRNLSVGQVELIKILQKFAFREHLERLRRSWRPKTLTHGDLRWDNCLIRDRSLRQEHRLKIVDWEFAGVGDPACDIGFVFADYLSFWISLFPVTGYSQPDRYVGFAEIPLERMQPALRSFWSSYCRRICNDAISKPADARELLSRSVNYAGVRLIQTAFQQMDGSTQLSGAVICLAQLSLSIFQRPQQACRELFGIQV